MNLTRQEQGFTLIEIIVTILLGSILAALMFQFMGTALTGSSGPVNIVRDGADVEAIMEEIIADYVKRINTNPATALALMKADADALVYGSAVKLTGSAPLASRPTPSSRVKRTQRTSVRLPFSCGSE